MLIHNGAYYLSYSCVKMNPPKLLQVCGDIEIKSVDQMVGQRGVGYIADGSTCVCAYCECIDWAVSCE